MSKNYFNIGDLIKVDIISDIRIKFINPDTGNLQDINFYDDHLIGIITNIWQGTCINSVSEIEILSSGSFFVISSNIYLNRKTKGVLKL